ncbi:MAG: class I SAM-dependent methyltransferase [Deltaproteobacteria bacterium]|jgi:2-polyprenyl-6-hydroxyphenyl methylase/3-demethylubiquinone-9 3-methyltransferase|nr:class I SAM-dependent methyltransferase [Deltaproteobacteria bacterium]MBW2695553.1 class I SAM-dependent methyltransferase [Deltaproteobacteria bacterium]
MSEGLAPSEQVPTYEFGKNWAQFVDSSYSEERLRISQEHLLDFLRLRDLTGHTFMDVGCGSGLHSLAAHRAGADQVISLDVDEDSVATTRLLWEREGRPRNWSIHHGSVLDKDFLAGLEPVDILYSWGVLHHTGDMWQAIRNAAELMKPDGLMYIALYTTTHKSAYWIEVKKRYNLAGKWERRWIELVYLLRHRILIDLMARQSTFKLIREYEKNRGMEFMTNVRDWLGGWPYEDCSIDEFVDFAHDDLEAELIRIKTGEACTEYVLKKRHRAT